MTVRALSVRVFLGSASLSTIVLLAAAAPQDDATDPKHDVPKAVPADTLVQRANAARETWWAYRELRKPDAPEVADAAWCRSDIDRFLLARMEAKGLRPAPEADRAALIRRASLDLTGLPPSPAEVDAFVADTS
ncbi:MAG: DUF1549 domain-containing protein, partial [Phycisphaerales bacterium]